jgi:hypothetical protein
VFDRLAGVIEDLEAHVFRLVFSSQFDHIGMSSVDEVWIYTRPAE